jgi:hypothetical protein
MQAVTVVEKEGLLPGEGPFGKSFPLCGPHTCHLKCRFSWSELAWTPCCPAPLAHLGTTWSNKDSLGLASRQAAPGGFLAAIARLCPGQGLESPSLSDSHSTTSHRQTLS